jgi:hypothetical protein
VADFPGSYGLVLLDRSHIAFGSAAQSESVDIQYLTPDQRLVLEPLANKNSPCWKINVNMANLLRAYGLPDWPDKLQAALAPQSP